MKNLDENKIEYITHLRADKSDGVYYKIEGMMAAARRMGYVAKSAFRGVNQSVMERFRRVVETDAKYVIVRYMGSKMLLMVPMFLRARAQGKVLIVDIPTPIVTSVQEIKMIHHDRLVRWMKIAMRYVNGPVPFWCFNKIVEYADEGRWFLLGNRGRVLMTTNGIDEERLPLCKREDMRGREGKELVLVGVANLYDYHGYDRVIRAMAEWKRREDRKFDVKFNIIGGEGYDNLGVLKRLVSELGLERDVIFHGNQAQEYVQRVYEESDLGIGAIAVHRKNLYKASPLKTREYALAGLPFMTSDYEDADFPKELPFNFVVPADDSVEEIVRVFEEFDRVRAGFTAGEIRRYCVERCSFEERVKEMISF